MRVYVKENCNKCTVLEKEENKERKKTAHSLLTLLKVLFKNIYTESN